MSISVILAMLLSLLSFSTIVNASDDYPSKYKKPARDAVVDEWNFYNRECTSFVAWCLNSRNGVAFTSWYGSVRWGNGKNWGDAAKSLGITVDNSPAVGSVAWSAKGQYGHVAYVTAVSGNNVTIEEYNYNYDGNYSSRTVAVSSFSGYIHIKDTTPTVSASAPTNASVKTDKSEYLKGEFVKITPSATGMNFYTIRIENENGTVEFSDYSGTLKQSLDYTPIDTGKYTVYISACSDWKHYTDTSCSFIVKTQVLEDYIEDIVPEIKNNQAEKEVGIIVQPETTEYTEQVQMVEQGGPVEKNGQISDTEKIELTETEKNAVEDKAYSFRFPRTNVYHQDQFYDVKANQWFTQTVADAFEMGLVKGMSTTEFSPYGDVTVAEAITMAARIHRIYTSGIEDFASNGGMWYQVYLDYAYENGVISRAYYNSDVSQKATRAQFAEIFANAMDDIGLYPISTVADNAIPDVKMTATYANDVYKLYRAGILAGNDTLGTFSPNTYITRAEASAILARMADINNRLTFTIR